ncbi:unannotated protein [freshwater metagenome]|uniref:Unannotated protein n=1 Tax=freshwater metagenome TaxID=449393 RepID=A0A6J6E512_9ZZZZ|nr:hypothetical protein [Actinomycetota bacterium]
MKITTKIATSATVAVAASVMTLVAASPASALPSIAWSDTSITNGESTSLVYTMGNTTAFVAQWYDDQYIGCSWKSRFDQNLPATYEQARATTSQATTWWIGLYSSDCTSAQPLKSDAYSSTELTMTPAGPYGPDEVTSSDITETSITLNWETDAYATGYHVYQDGQLIATLDADDVLYRVTGLTAGTSYTFEVVGFNDDFGGAGTTVTLSTTKGPELATTGIDVTVAGLMGFGALSAVLIGGALVLRRRA